MARDLVPDVDSSDRPLGRMTDDLSAGSKIRDVHALPLPHQLVEIQFQFAVELPRLLQSRTQTVATHPEQPLYIGLVGGCTFCESRNELVQLSLRPRVEVLHALKSKSRTENGRKNKTARAFRFAISSIQIGSR